MQQMVPEYFGGSAVVEALSWRIVVGLEELSKALSRKSSEVGLSWKCSSETSDGVFDTTFVPRRVGVADEALLVDSLTWRDITAEQAVKDGARPPAGFRACTGVWVN